AFLDGRDRSMLKTLKRQMDEAAAAFQFERATALRDRLQAVQWLDDRLGLLRDARERESFVYPLAGPDGRVRWDLIHRGQVQAVAFPPTTTDSASGLTRLLAATFTDHPAPAVLSDVAVDSVLLVSAWFRKHADERAKLLTKANAEEICGKPV